MKTKSYGIKKKFMAAVSMLLVSAIMLVSTTYAWFTLSTAPEITGISTTVGSNGNLEMALLPESGLTSDITTSVGDSNLVTTESNVTWGNLVDLSDLSYGLDSITLLPSELNYGTDGTTVNTSSILTTPSYGADGRISELVANTSLASYTATTGYFDGTYSGVNAIGVIGGISDRQYDFRNYKANVNSYISSATSAAVTSLANNGDALASLALALNDDEGTGEYISYVDDIEAMIESLQESVAYMNKAMVDILVVYAAQSEISDDEYEAAKLILTADVVDVVDFDDADLTSIITADVSTIINQIETIETALTSATTELAKISGTASKDEITAALTPLVRTSAVTLNEDKIDGLSASDLSIVDLMNDGFNIGLPDGSGVYSDIAELVGDYSAYVTLSDITYDGMDLSGLTVKITASGADTTGALNTLSTSMNNLVYDATGEEAGTALTETYGYAIDLAFQTNAAGSNLLLQTEETQRIYSDSENETTMGGGSSMTFESSDTSFSSTQVLSLMDSIKVVFIDEEGTILLEAELDTENATATTTGSGYTADIVPAEGYEDAVITSLTQNVATVVTAIVYLDGEDVTNADVAISSTSMTGTMNLQFASDADLVPMSNADLYTIEDSTTSTESTESSDEE